ncbi:hypothetical protein TNCV_831281 [Trichonephila clavipes]|nr:hypothetical protein TNCV_831281 [Trichonephila clavipes]
MFHDKEPILKKECPRSHRFKIKHISRCHYTPKKSPFAKRLAPLTENSFVCTTKASVTPWMLRPVSDGLGKGPRG